MYHNHIEKLPRVDLGSGIRQFLPDFVLKPCPRIENQLALASVVERCFRRKKNDKETDRTFSFLVVFDSYGDGWGPG